jgi:FSR family fosmidomycin resistance protein-like MFS transporter
MADRSLNKTVYRMASAHFVADAYSNLYVPLLPALISRLGLSLTAAGTMVMLYQIATSVTQLGFGRLADRWNPRVLLVAGPLLSVAVLSLIGLSWSPLSLAACLVVGGLGGAAFHPTAAAVVNRLGGSRRGLASISPADRLATRSARWCSRRMSIGLASRRRPGWRFPDSCCWA